MVQSANRGRPKLTKNEQLFFETLYATLKELLRVAEHLNLRDCASAVNELLDELETKLQVDAAAESSE